MSPPKSCVLFEPISESFHHKGNYKVRKRLLHFLLEFIAVVHRFPHPLAVMLLRDSLWSIKSSLGFNNLCILGIGKRKVEASPGWFMCPPKTCVYLEPLDEISLNNVVDGWQMPMTIPFQSAKKFVFSKGR